MTTTPEERAANVKHVYGCMAVDNLRPSDLAKKMLDELYVSGKETTDEIKKALIKHYTAASIDKDENLEQ